MSYHALAMRGGAPLAAFEEEARQRRVAAEDGYWADRQAQCGYPLSRQTGVQAAPQRRQERHQPSGPSVASAEVVHHSLAMAGGPVLTRHEITQRECARAAEEAWQADLRAQRERVAARQRELAARRRKPKPRARPRISLAAERAERERVSEWWAEYQRERAAALYRLGVVQIVHAWIQAIAPQSGVKDIVAGYGQHIQPFGGEVLMLPLAVAAWLMTNQPTEWQQMTVYPVSITPVNDPASGLDTAAVASTGVWGYDPTTKSAWFTLDGDIGESESAYLYLDSKNQPWLVQ